MTRTRTRTHNEHCNNSSYTREAAVSDASIDIIRHSIGELLNSLRHSGKRFRVRSGKMDRELRQLFLVFLLVFSFNQVALSQNESAKMSLEQSEELYQAKKYDSSLLLIDKILQMPAASANPKIQVRAALLKVSNYNRKRLNEERLAAADQALALATQYLKADTLYAEALRAKGDAFIRLRQYDSSVHYLKLAEKRYFELTLWSDASACKVGQGANYYRQRQFARADTVLSAAMRMMEDKMDTLPSIYGTASNLLGAAYQALGDHEKALRNYLSAVRFHEKHSQDTQRLIYAYNNLGIAYSRRGDYEKAGEFLQLASVTGEKGASADYDTQAAIYSNLMLVNTRQAEFDKAIDYADKWNALFNSKKSDPSANARIKFFNNLGLLHIETRSFDKGYQALSEALTLDSTRAQTQANLGYYYYRLGANDKAEKWLNAAITQYGNKEPVSVSKLYRYRAAGAVKSKNYTQAFNDLNKAITLLAPSFSEAGIYDLPELRNLRSKRELLRTLTARAGYMAEVEAPAKAIKDNLLHSIALADSMYYEYKAEGSRLFLKNEVLPLYEITLDLLTTEFEKTRDEGLLEMAFIIIETSKSSLLTDLLQVKSTNKLAGVPKELILKEQSLEIDIAFYEQEEYLAASGDNTERQQLYREYKLSKINEKEQLLEQLEAQHPRYFEARHSRTSPSLNVARSRLNKASELMIEYFAGEHFIYALAVSQGETHLLKLAPTAPVQRKAGQFITAVNQPETVVRDAAMAYEILSESGNALYEALIQPIKKLIGRPVTSIHLIPDGFLNYLPFEALLTSLPTARGARFTDLPYLIRETGIRYSYAASLPRAFSGKSQKVLAMAPFGAEDLKNTNEEVRSIKSHFGNGSFYADSGTEQFFKKEANRFGVLHLATHGRLNTENPALSYLAFGSTGAEDGRLHAYELENMNLNAQMVVLSACETGTGNLVTGEGVMSLARAFSYTGVPSTVMSLWQVDDRSGSELIEQFYAGLSKDMPKDAALRKAKLSYLESSDQLHAHPYFWSQFVLIGDPSPLQSSWEKRWARITILLISASLLLIAIRFIYQRKNRG